MKPLDHQVTWLHRSLFLLGCLTSDTMSQKEEDNDFKPCTALSPTHSSTLVWRIPWTEEPGGLYSVGSQRVGRDWSNLASKQALPCLMSLFHHVSWWGSAFLLSIAFSSMAYTSSPQHNINKGWPYHPSQWTVFCPPFTWPLSPFWNICLLLWKYTFSIFHFMHQFFCTFILYLPSIKYWIPSNLHPTAFLSSLAPRAFIIT